MSSYRKQLELLGIGAFFFFAPLLLSFSGIDGVLFFDNAFGLGIELFCLADSGFRVLAADLCHFQAH